MCDIAVRLTNPKENTIIYNNYKSGTERYAKEIISRLDQKEIHFETDDPIYKIFLEHLENTYSEEWIVAKALKYGIGIHHGLVPKYIQKEIINLFNRGILLYLISTTTITELSLIHILRDKSIFAHVAVPFLNTFLTKCIRFAYHPAPRCADRSMRKPCM